MRSAGSEPLSSIESVLRSNTFSVLTGGLSKKHHWATLQCAAPVVSFDGFGERADYFLNL